VLSTVYGNYKGKGERKINKERVINKRLKKLKKKTGKEINEKGKERKRLGRENVNT
jgi:hypothetical protein